MIKGFSRRAMLRGAGLALTVPWLETLAPRTARAQAAAAGRKRYVSMFYPHGSVPWYWPTNTGTGDAWQLPSVTAPLAPLKSKLTFLGGVSNYGPFGGHIEPSHGNVCAATFTCTARASSAVSVVPM